MVNPRHYPTTQQIHTRRKRTACAHGTSQASLMSAQEDGYPSGARFEGEQIGFRPGYIRCNIFHKCWNNAVAQRTIYKGNRCARRRRCLHNNIDCGARGVVHLYIRDTSEDARFCLT